MKMCNTCNEIKTLDMFAKAKSGKDGTRNRCKPCRNKVSAAHYKANTDSYKRAHAKWREKIGLDYFKNHRLQTKYGMSLDKYKELLKEQNGVCFICKNPPKGRNKLAVDHNHITGKIRKLLCGPCNRSLGLIKENFDTALNLAKYIQEDQGVV